MPDDFGVLLPYQKAWVADESDVQVCEKSRRVGISWSEASRSALDAASSRAAGGQDVWYIGYTKDMAQEFIGDVAFWARHYDVAADDIQEEVFIDEDKDILTYVIRFASGFRVTALSSRPTNLRGKQGIVIIDEAAFHPDLPGLLKAALAFLMWGGKVRVVSTHNGDINPFNDLILDIRAGKKPYSLHRFTFDDAVKAGLYRRICLRTGRDYSKAAEVEWVKKIRADYGDDADEELDVIPSSGAGAYLTRAAIEAAMLPGIPVVRLALKHEFAQRPKHEREAEIADWCEEALQPLLDALDPELDHYFGEDFARSGDLTVIWPVAQTRMLELDTPFVVELRNVPFEQQKQILFFVVDRLPRFAAGALDARGNGQYLAEVAMQRYGGGRIAQVMLSTEWYRQHMPRFKSSIEERTVPLPKDADILADMRLVKMDRGIAKVPDNARARGSDGKDRHGDSAIALALAEYAVHEMEPAPIEYTPAPPKSDRWDARHEDAHDLVYRGGGAW